MMFSNDLFIIASDQFILDFVLVCERDSSRFYLGHEDIRQELLLQTFSGIILLQTCSIFQLLTFHGKFSLSVYTYISLELMNDNFKYVQSNFVL